MSGIYIHIPFCRQACSYCDFFFVTRDRLIPAFVDQLVDEIRHPTIPEFGPVSKNISENISDYRFSAPVKTLYFGGGTPSRLEMPLFERIVDAVWSHFDMSGLQEFTVEVNPEDIGRNWLEKIRQMGVTRLSLGIQSFRPELLEFMHRAHTSRQAHDALEMVAGTGFDSFSADLIYGSPGQTRRQLEEDLNQLLNYDPPHISAYSLTIEPKTRLGKQYELGRLNPADGDDIHEQYLFITSALEDRGIHRYEISNFAKPWHRAVHNSSYWTHENYIGLGPSAHSFFHPGGQGAAFRWQQPSNVHNWRQPSECEELSGKRLAEERIMIGLRTADGVTLEELRNRYDYELTDTQWQNVERFREEGLMQGTDVLRLTESGLSLADSITVRLLSAQG